MLGSNTFASSAEFCIFLPHSTFLLSYWCITSAQQYANFFKLESTRYRYIKAAWYRWYRGQQLRLTRSLCSKTNPSAYDHIPRTRPIKYLRHVYNSSCDKLHTKLRYHHREVFFFCEKKIILCIILQNIAEGTLPWVIFRFRIFSNYFSQKFEKIKITV